MSRELTERVGLMAATEAPIAVTETDVTAEMPHVVRRCPRCLRAFNLWFNGGELDHTACCGLMFTLASDTVILRVAEL